MTFETIREKPVRYAIGLTAGGSCQGVDGALVRIKGSGPELHLKLVGSKQVPYSRGFRARLLVSRKEAREIGLLNFELGAQLAEVADGLIKVAHEELCEVDFVGAQGYVLSHTAPRGGQREVGGLQIGEASVVAETTKLPVVSDFRMRDLAAGGQGAPLSAYADWLLFGHPERTVVRLHLGSVASLTVATPSLEHVMAFDTGPGNLAIDGAVSLLSGGTQDMDKKGAFAAKGVVIDEFLEYLLEQSYLGRVPPKSTGREEFGVEAYLRDALMGRKDHPLEDVVATVTAAVAYSIIRAYNRFVKPQFNVARVIVSGGGAANKALMRHLKKGLKDTVVRTTEHYGLPWASLDAIASAVLANETLCGLASNIPQATGARHPVLLGKITPS